MVGQKNLISKLSQYTIDTFPRSVLMLGEKGIGKHTLVNYIQKEIIKFNLIDITKSISAEYITQIYLNPNPAIYLIDLSTITEKEQNVLLKFIEEPLNNSFIILLAENKNFVLDTIANRCITFELEPYSKEELASFITVEKDAELILDILKTPGKIITSNLINMNDLFKLCNTIIDCIGKATYSNMLSITNKINFADDFNKFDLDIFLDSLTFLLGSRYIESGDIRIYEMYKIVSKHRKYLLDKRLNKQLFLENLLIKLWKYDKGIK